MSLQIKYYSFEDPITGVLTKDYGWVVTKSIKNIKIKGDELISESDQEVTRTIAPKDVGVAEISKVDFDKIDTTGESATIQLRREANYLRVKRLLEKEALPEVAPVSAATILQKFKGIHKPKA